MWMRYSQKNKVNATVCGAAGVKGPWGNRESNSEHLVHSISVRKLLNFILGSLCGPRVWSNGRASVFHAEGPGSIPTAAESYQRL